MMVTSRNSRPSNDAVHNYRADIDGLRAIAVISVLLYHSGISAVSGGYIGVDIFFVISGYLITGHLAAEIDQNRLSIRRFYANRIRRIVPALFIILILVWLAGLIFYLPDDFVRLSSALVATAASVSNIYFLKYTSYFAPNAVFQPLLHTWSLSIEEQFYFFIPLTMMFASKIIRGNWLLLFGPLCLLSFVLSLYLTTRLPVTNFYFMPPRAWELGIGSVLATTRLPQLRARWLVEFVSVVGLLMVVVPLFVFNELTPFPGLNALYPCLGTALLIYAGQGRAGAIITLLGIKPFVWVGRISYSIYLIHWPVIVFTRYNTLAPLTDSQIAAVISISLGLGYLSWRFFEQPFRRPSAMVTQPRLLFGGLGAIVITGLIGLLGIKANGFPTRFPTYVEHVPGAKEAWKSGSCFLMDGLDYKDWNATECTRIASGPHKVLLWGDSFAAQYMPGILAYGGLLKQTVIQYTAAACPPVLSWRSFAHIHCSDFNAHALDIIRDQGIDTVILAGLWTTLERNGLDEVGDTVKILLSMGLHVVVIGQSPEFAVDPHKIAYLAKNQDAGPIKRWDIAFNLTLNDKLAEISRPARFINPMSVLCEGLRCIYEDNGVFLFDDYGHLSEEGSRRAVLDLFVKKRLLDS